MANSEDRRINQNRDEVITLTLVQEDGTPFDLTGLLTTAIQWGFAATAAATAPIVTKTIGAGVTIGSPPTAGVITVAIDAADTDDQSGSFYHEATVTIAGDTKQGSAGVLEIAVTLLNPPA